MNGTVTAGIFHQLNITIPDDKTATDSNGNPIYSHIVIVNGTRRPSATAPKHEPSEHPDIRGVHGELRSAIQSPSHDPGRGGPGRFSNPGEAAVLEMP